MLTDYGYAPGFSTTASAAANAALNGEQRGQLQASQDQFSRFQGMGSAQEAVARGINTRFGDLGGASSRNIALQASQQDLTGRRAAQDQYFQGQEQQKDLDMNNYFTRMSLNQRNSEIATAQDEAEKKRKAAMYNAIYGFVAKMSGSAIGGAPGGAAGGATDFSQFTY